VSLRARFLVYLVAVHVLMAGVAAWLVRSNPLWLGIAEVLFAASFLAGLALVRRFFASMDFINESAQLLEDSDLMSRYREVGQPGVDRLIRVYNRMVDSLRDERVGLQEQQQFLARVLKESPAGILVLDFDRRVEMGNPAALRLLQVEPAGVIGRTLEALGGALASELVSLADGQARVVPLWGGRRVRAAHLSFLDRGFRRSFFLLEELTEELRQSEKAAYEKLIRMLSHEVNNTVGASHSLLTSCLSYGEQLQADDRTDFEHAIAVVIGRTAQLNAFMRSFADVVRLPAPRREPVSIDTLVDDLVRLMGPECQRRGIALTQDVAADLPAVSLDRAQMEQALLNIAKNGMEAVGRDGALAVRAYRRDGIRVLEVEDTGPGISPDAREQLFTPFFSTKEGGQGIGLTLVQEILANHRFGYALDGPPGGPTRFTILLD
jgi:two-component system, NtrC family, nitrogen regulation sensor histidine kinase NtrY